MDACPTCPNRWIARLARSIGDEDLAREIEAAGCNNWKRLEEKIEDRDTGQVLEVRTVSRCMRDRMVSYLNAVHAEAHRNGKAAESHRNVVAEGFSYLAGRPITGDCEGLPVEFREALLEAGIGTPLALPPATEQETPDPETSRNA